MYKEGIFMFSNFEFEAQNILVKAKIEMNELKHPYIGTEHLVLSILKNDNVVSDKLKKYNLTYDKFKKEIIRIIGVGSRESSLFLYTPLLRKVIENAVLDSKENNDGNVTTMHLFSALLESGEGIAIRIFLGMNINLSEMYDDFSLGLIKKSKVKKGKKMLIEELGVNLTERAKNNELDPVIERDDEIKRLLEVLCRRCKNNPILIGEAGVGKTAIVEELARMIVSGMVPNTLKDKKIISLDMASAVAGTKYRGEFEDRMKKILKEIEENPDIILFIDEIHTLVGAGGAEGAIDASNILKPALARGKVRCIGATTLAEYKKYIEKDGALDRRFQKIIIEEPSSLKTKKILASLKPIYENYHKVKIEDSLLDKIITLSDKYIYDRYRPDKAIDVLDEVCSRVSIKENSLDKDILFLNKEINRIKKEKNSFILENKFDEAYELRKKEASLMSKLNEISLNYSDGNRVVTIEDIASVINIKTKIPVYEILKEDMMVINKIKEDLANTIVGQDEVIDELIDITKRIKYGYSDNKCYSLLFMGPSGIGKTLISKIYAKNLVGEDNFIRLDMSEYSDVTSINKIVGSSPGYVGYDDNKNILEEVRNKPNSVILLDEIDKAHPKVINLFYQILDEGKLKDSKGNIVRFDNSIIIMTSNIGFEKNVVGFNDDKRGAVSKLKEYFNLAFINRIDNVIVFNKLKEESILKIINKKIDNLKAKYSDINIKVSKGCIKEIIAESQYDLFGARKIDKIIRSKIEKIIIDKVFNNEVDVKIDSIKKQPS